jgi:hypothetical protein
VGKEIWDWKEGVGSLGGNGGEIVGCGHGGRGLKWEGPCTTKTTLLIDIRNNYEQVIAICQKRWGVIGGRLMSIAVER